MTAIKTHHIKRLFKGGPLDSQLMEEMLMGLQHHSKHVMETTVASPNKHNQTGVSPMPGKGKATSHSKVDKKKVHKCIGE